MMRRVVQYSLQTQSRGSISKNQLSTIKRIQLLAQREVSYVRNVSLLGNNFNSFNTTSSGIINMNSCKNNQFALQKRGFSSKYPEHKVVSMPALSPTMEVGSIANWLVKEGERFAADQAICEVETDKATVTYDATDEGVIAKILVGQGEIKVGAPLMVVVEDASTVPAFKDFVIDDIVSIPVATDSKPKQVETKSTPPPTPSSPTPSSASQTISVNVQSNNGRVVASPFAKKLASESNINLSQVQGTGPNGRVVAINVLDALQKGTATPKATQEVISKPIPAGIQQADVDILTVSSLSEELAKLFTQSKKEVPHYSLSVEVDLSNVRHVLKQLAGLDKNGAIFLTEQHVLIKAAAMAMRKVPDANASWQGSFVRRYKNVNVNFISGAGNDIHVPIVENVESKGLLTIAKELADAHASPNKSALPLGTFAIHDLSSYGIKSANPIVLPPQSTALSFGSIIDTVLPATKPVKEGEPIWRVAPVIVVTLSCDHRVVDGAVGAQWLAAFKENAENPLNMLL